MATPQRYGYQTYAGAAVILMGLGFVGAQLLAPKASTANTPAVAARPAPRIIEINTKRDDAKPAEPTAVAAPLAAPQPGTPSAAMTPPAATPPQPGAAIPPPPGSTAQPTPQFATPATPPVSAAELKRKAQEEASQVAADGDAQSEAAAEQRRRSQPRSRYPRFDRHAVY